VAVWWSPQAGSGGNATAGSGGLGPFKKKCLILAILETDGKTQVRLSCAHVCVVCVVYVCVVCVCDVCARAARPQATAALGRVVIDLSEYAAIEHQETRTFMVSCNKVVHAAVGDPQLMVTIRCGSEPQWGGACEQCALGLAPGTCLPTRRPHCLSACRAAAAGRSWPRRAAGARARRCRTRRPPCPPTPRVRPGAVLRGEARAEGSPSRDGRGREARLPPALEAVDASAAQARA
jgi:hypothetical protein